MQLPTDDNPSSPPARKTSHLHDLLLIPFGCILRTPLLLVLAALIAGGIWFAYANFNWNIFGIAAPTYQNWQIDRDFTSVKDVDGKSWQISYESNRISTYVGSVRHVTPIVEFRYPILSHDILVTSGDYANPDIVATSVSNHHFKWYTIGKNTLTGSIHLLHTVPENEEIYNALLQIRKGDAVRIIGREIKSIDFYQKDGRKAATWIDTGCNTLLVTSVEFLPEK